VLVDYLPNYLSSKLYIWHVIMTVSLCRVKRQMHFHIARMPQGGRGRRKRGKGGGNLVMWPHKKNAAGSLTICSTNLYAVGSCRDH